MKPEIAMTIEWVPIDGLKPHPKNRNTHPPDQIKRLAEIIRYQGFRHPIIVSTLSGFIVAGHGRLEAAKELGLQRVPVHFQSFEDEDQEYAFLVSDNAIALWAELDLSGINADVGDLGPDFNLDLLGIKDFVLDMSEKQGDPDAVPEVPKVAKTRRGELWTLGNHRLLIDDCTVKENVERLMDLDRAALFLTDPPYGVSYVEKNAAVHGGIVENAVGKKISNDDLSLDDCGTLWKSAAENAYSACSDDASYYWFACQGGDQMMMMMMCISEANWKVRHELIWVKPSMVFGRCDYHYRHEPILYGWKKDGTHHYYNDRTQTSVLEFDRPHKSDLHPTTKPSDLIEYLMGNSSRPGEIVLDLFGGSGTTLIACEKLGRNCRMTEIDPPYADVILERFAKFSGKDPVREDGVKWSQLKGQVE